jgi:hypothetical protein
MPRSHAGAAVLLAGVMAKREKHLTWPISSNTITVGAADPWNEVKNCFAYCKSALE